MGLAHSVRAVVEQLGGAYEDYDDADDTAAVGSLPPESAGAAQRGKRHRSAEHAGICPDEPDVRSEQEREASPLALVRAPRLGFSRIAPQEFDEAQQIAERLRANAPVIVDMGSCERDVEVRLTDFCSGLCYALGASLNYIGERVVLLAPHDVELGSEPLGGPKKRRFFNQV